MKTILNLLIIVQFSACDDSSVYNWNIRTIERGPDFKKDLKEQKNFENEIQKDFLQLSDKTYHDDESIYDKLFNKKLNSKYTFNSDNINIDKNVVFKEENSYPFNENMFTKDENENSRLNTNFIMLQNKNFKDLNRKESNYNNNRQYSNAINYGDRGQRNYNVLSLFSKNNNYNEPKIDEISYNFPNEQSDEHFEISNIDRYNVNNSSNFQPFPLYETKYNRKNNIQNIPRKNFTLINQCTGKFEDIESFVGTNLLDNTIKRCFSTEDVVLLTTRRDFENLIPKDLPQCLFSDRMVQVLLNYFYICHQIIIEKSSDDLMQLTLKAFYDTLGGYLNYYMVPVAKYSYYAGHIALSTVQQILILYQQCKIILNTNGNGWKTPIQNVLVELNSIQIAPLNILPLNQDKFDEPSFCMHLDIATEEYQPHGDKMIVQIPKLEAEDLNGYLGNVWLPFRRKKMYDLKADSSAYIIVKFYETVTKCYRYENIDQSYYNSQFKLWLLESIHTHLSDEQFYPGLGAVLRIYEFLKRTKKDVKTNRENKNLYKLKSTEQNDKFDNLKIVKNNAKIVNKGNLLHTNETNRKTNDNKKNSIGTSQINNSISRGIVKKQFINAAVDESESMMADNKESINTKVKLRNIDITPFQITVIAIPAVAIILVVTICCYKSCCRKKKPELPTKKNSSSSSSNLFNSPVRFFHVRPKSVSDYSSNDLSGKKNKKTVKIKKTSLNSDTSASSSPVRNKSKGKIKDSSKSNVYL